MGWKFSRISTSLPRTMREPDAVATPDLERIRTGLVACIASHMNAHNAHRPVWRKLLRARDIQTLWYLRSDVMHLLCDHCGEAAANEQLQAITELFRGHVPAAQFASTQRRG